MKKKMIIAMISIAVILAGGIFLVVHKTAEEPVPTDLISTSQAADPADNTVLKDETTSFDIQEAAEKEEEKANGTGEDAAIENEYDQAYQDQLNEEAGETEATEETETDDKAGENIKTMYVTAKVNVREQPSTSAVRLGELKRGDTVDVAAIRDNWASIVFDNQVGYVSADYLSDTMPAAQSSGTAQGKGSSGSGSGKNTGSGSTGQSQDQAQSSGKSDVLVDTSTNAGQDTTGNTGTGVAGLTPEQQAYLDSIGATTGVDMSDTAGENSHVGYVDPNGFENWCAENGIDPDSITVH